MRSDPTDVMGSKRHLGFKILPARTFEIDSR